MANIQFNSKDAKTFRTLCEKYYNAQHSIKDAMNRKSDTIASLQTILDNDTADLDAIADGSYSKHRSEDDIRADIADMTARIATAQSDYKDAVSKYDKAIENALALYTDGLHKAASEVVSSFGSDDAIAMWRTALADMLVANGIADATPDNVARFDFLVAVRNNSARKVYKTNSLIGVGGKKQSAVVFLNALVEYLVTVDAIKPFAHKYIPVSERKKADK